MLVVGWVLAVVGLLAYGLSVSAENYIEKELVRPALEMRTKWLAEALPMLESDFRALSALADFRPRNGVRDAGELLNQQLGWSEPDADFYFGSQDPDGGQHLEGPLGRRFYELSPRLQSLGKSMPPFELDAEVAKELETLDFSWLTDLSRYDYWSLLTKSPLTEVPAGSRKALEPFSRALTRWSKLRLARALAERRLPEAERELTQLARLLISTESIAMVHQGLHVLELIELASGRDPEVLRTLKQLSLGLPLITDAMTPREVMERFDAILEREAPALWCAAWEEAKAQYGTRPVTGEYVPEYFEVLGARTRNERCRWESLARYRARSGDTPLAFLDETDEGTYLYWGVRLPFASRPTHAFYYFAFLTVYSSHLEAWINERGERPPPQ
ncbi:MAG: hypothetical protein HY791_17400 [Deltaproteobacteria bacterium]|nr:hypothetical protein [Deltaproteobacteria bacterium]